MPEFKISTKYGSFVINADRAPTPEESEQIAYAYTRNNLQQSAITPDQDAALINKGLDIFLDTVPALAGGLVGQRLGGRAGATFGATSASAIANWAKQKMQIERGERKDFQAGELAAATVAAVPFLSSSKIGSSIPNRVVRTGLTSGGEAAILATTAETVRSALDEGKLPDIVDLSKQAGAGFLMGLGTGATFAKYARDGALIKNPMLAAAGQAAAAGGAGLYTFQELQDKGDPNALPKAIGIAALVYGGTHVPSVIAQAGAPKAKLALIGPEAVIGAEATGAIRGAEEMLNGMNAEANILGDQINKIILKQPQPMKAAEDVLAAMQGHSVQNLPPEVEPYINRFKELRVENSDKILFLYPHLDDQLKNKIKDEAATYTRRVYRAHMKRSNYKAGVDYARPQDAAAFKQELINDITSSNPNVSVQDAGRMADATMTRMLDDVGYVTSGAVDEIAPNVGKAGSSLMRRGNIGPAGRKFLGEVTDPGMVLAETLDAQSRLIVTQQRDKQIVDFLEKSGLASRNQKRNATDQLLVSSESSVLHPEFENVYAAPEVNAALREMFSPHLLGDGKILGGWLELLGISKASKTVLNPLESIVPQIYGNAALAASSWKASPKYIIDAVRQATFLSAGKVGKSLSPQEKIAQAKMLKKLTQLGIASNSYDVQELRTLFRLSGEGKSYKDVIDKFSKVYSSPDAIFRYGVWKSNVDELISFEKTPVTQNRLAEIEKEAANITNNQFPTYNRVPRRYRQASAIGLANAFGAFEFEVIRNSINQLQYAAKLIRDGSKTGNTNMTIAGVKRLIGFMAVAGTTAGIAGMGSRALGVSQDEEEAMKLLTPKFDKDKALMFGKTEDGNIWYAPLNYLAPLSNSVNAVAQLVGGGDPIPAIKSSLLGTDLGPMATPIIEGLSNTYYNTNVPIELPRDNVRLLARTLNSAFMPGAISGTFERMRKASSGQTNALGMAYTWSDVFKRLGGVRGNTADPIRLAEIAAKDAIDKVIAIQAGYRRVLNQASKRGGAELAGLDENALYSQRNREYLNAQIELGKVYAAMKTLQKTMPNITDTQIIKAFESAGVSRKLILGAAMNSPIPMNRGLAQSNSDFFEEIVAMDQNKADALMRSRSGGSSSEYLKLKKEYRDFRKEVKQGMKDPVTSLMAGMGIADGERAKTIFYVTRNYSQKDREEFYSRLRKRGILTPEVRKQIQQLERRSAQ